MATTHHLIKDNFWLIYPDSKDIDKSTVKVCPFVNKQIPLVDLNFFSAQST